MVLGSIFSMGALNVVKGAVALGLSVAVAALVAPADYGLVAFSLPLVSLIMLLTDLGLTAAIVRRERLAPEEAGTVVLFVDALGLTLAAALAATAGLVERAAALPGLAHVLIGFAVVASLSVSATIRRGMLERRMAFRQVAAIETAGVALGLTAAGLALAFRLGIYAILAYQVAFNLTRLVMFSRRSRRDYVYAWWFAQCRDLFATAGTLFAANAFNFAARNVDNILIGSVIGATGLGLYAVAYQFMTVPLVLLAWPATGIVLSALARIGPDRTRQRGLVTAIFTLVSCVTFPLMAFLVVGSRWPIEQVYGERWRLLPDIVALLAPIGALQSIAVFNGAVLVNAGRLRLNLMFGIVNGSLVTAGSAVSVWFGFGAVVATYCATAAVGSLLAIALMCRELGISPRAMVLSLVPGLAAAMAGTACAWLAVASPRSWAGWSLFTLAYGAGGLVAFLAFNGAVRRAIASLVASSDLIGARLAPSSPDRSGD